MLYTLLFWPESVGPIWIWKPPSPRWNFGFLDVYGLILQCFGVNLYLNLKTATTPRRNLGYAIETHWRHQGAAVVSRPPPKCARVVKSSLHANNRIEIPFQLTPGVRGQTLSLRFCSGDFPNWQLFHCDNLYAGVCKYMLGRIAHFLGIQVRESSRFRGALLPVTRRWTPPPPVFTLMVRARRVSPSPGFRTPATRGVWVRWWGHVVVVLQIELLDMWTGDTRHGTATHPDTPLPVLPIN